MRIRVAAVLLGVGFGFLLSWSRLSDPRAIRQMLLLQNGYFWWMFFTAVGVAFVGCRLLRRARWRALLTGQPVSLTTMRPGRRHVVGSALFGVGWSVSDSCPGPIAAQLGEGLVWSVFTILGVGIGISLFFRRQRRRVEAPEPALVD